MSKTTTQIIPWPSNMERTIGLQCTKVPLHHQLLPPVKLNLHDGLFIQSNFLILFQAAEKTKKTWAID